MSDDKMNKHQEMARTGHYKGFASGGHVHMSEHIHDKAGHKEVEDHVSKGNKGGHHEMPHGTHHSENTGHKNSIHCVTNESGESTSPWDTDSIGTDGGKKHLDGGGTGGTRNRY